MMYRTKRCGKKLIVLAVLLFPFAIFAQLRLPKIFTDHMVLQRGKTVSVWGDADPHATVTVKFQKQLVKTIADEKGSWKVELQPLLASKQPHQLLVQTKKEKIQLDNVLVGEVWLVSGQSNMEYSMNNHLKYAKPKQGDPEYLRKAFDQANSPNIRVVFVEKNIKTDTLPTKGWKTLSSESLTPVSAIGYFFAKALHDSLDVPVGIISTSWGGTAIETWTSEDAYLQSPVFRDQVKNHKLGYEPIGERYEKMVRPIIPYTMKGFLWYQGETNLTNGDIDIYANKQKVLIESWRSAWKDNGLSFYYVQLAPYIYSQRRQDLYTSNWESLPKFWESQKSNLNIPNTGMVVTTDLVDDARDIHPSYKWIIAERLARLALTKDYAMKNIIYSGPVYKAMNIQPDQLILEFDHAGDGLMTKDGKSPDWFFIKGKNGKYAKAQAEILNKNSIAIKYDARTQHPIVRFAWDEIAMPNLFNSTGLPTVPFRTEKD